MVGTDDNGGFFANDGADGDFNFGDGAQLGEDGMAMGDDVMASSQFSGFEVSGQKKNDSNSLIA
jgi:hypothetical protein